MFVRVDKHEVEIDGFSYIATDGAEEKVVLGECGTAGPSVIVKLGDGLGGYDESYLTVADIPLLIKALQAAYDHIQKGK